MKTRIIQSLRVIQALILLTFLTLMVLAFSSCSRGSRGSQKDFPSQYAGEFHHQYNLALKTIRDVGAHSVRESSVTARTVPGVRKQGGIWTWQVNHPGLPPNFWVAGLYYPSRKFLEVGAHPQHGNEIHWPTVHHEFIHHFLAQVGVSGHPPAYDRVYNWAYARRVTGQSLEILSLTGVIRVQMGTGNSAVLTVEHLGDTAVLHGFFLDDVQPLDARRKPNLF